MRIKSFSFECEDWVLQKIDLQEVNLIVGKNGNGKSNTLFYIKFLIHDIINQSQETAFLEKAKWQIELQVDSSNIYNYMIDSFINKKNEEVIRTEKLSKNDKLLINRTKKDSKIYSDITGRFDLVNPPNDTLVIHSRRDTKAYPFIEDILNWSKNIFLLEFTDISEDLKIFYDLDIPTIYNNLKSDQKNKVLNNLNYIGFNISKIEYKKNMVQESMILIHENGFEKPLNHISLSQGMRRSLELLIFIEHLMNRTNTVTFLIDDLGEGLDYIRATELGKMIYKLCQENNIQLIATSNDSFLMDVIDIDCWNVLHRKGKVVSTINIVNHPKLFEDFRYTGLSRFDFFSSDYIDSHL